VTSAFSLEGRVTVVTGGLGLIGRQLARALYDAGARVLIADLDGDACARAAESLGPRAAGSAIDITERASLERLRDTALGRWDRLDVLVHSAAADDKFAEGTADLSKFENYPVEMWRRAIDVNLTGTFLACQVLGSEMARRGTGSIITLGSTYGLVAPDQRIYRRPDGEQRFWKSAAYPAAKGGVVMLTRFLATYWADRGVRANVLCPGGVEQAQEPHFVEQYSARVPMGRMARPQELGGAAVFLASEASSYMTGATLVVDGGWTAW
jgi:NAD(P)-dependent dehydrogenase (short-subunit alcohol dehydrogenase family)